MVQLQKDIEKIEEAKIQLVGISYDSPKFLREFAKEHEITFPLLSDEESDVIDAYNLRNEEGREGSRYEGIPHPGTIVIDEKGIVRAKLFLSVIKRHTSEELIEAVKKID